MSDCSITASATAGDEVVPAIRLEGPTKKSSIFIIGKTNPSALMYPGGWSQIHQTSVTLVEAVAVINARGQITLGLIRNISLHVLHHFIRRLC
jgi:hypothetical protein